MNQEVKNKKILFADLDGTLIETISGEVFPKGIWDMKFRFDVLDAIKKLHPYYVFIVSNQGGIENGFVSQIHFNNKLNYICSSIKEYCNCHCDAMYCATNDKSNPNRKPNVGMLDSFKEAYFDDHNDYVRSTSLMIGDASGKEGQFSDSDKKTAENFGIDYMDVDDFVNTNLED